MLLCLLCVMCVWVCFLFAYHLFNLNKSPFLSIQKNARKSYDYNVYSQYKYNVCVCVFVCTANKNEPLVDAN
jgi:hypothetical protein